MAYRSHYPSPIHVRKPSNLMSTFTTKINSAILPQIKGSLGSITDSPTSFSPVLKPKIMSMSSTKRFSRESGSLSPLKSRTSLLKRSPTFDESPVFDDYERKSTIKLGKLMYFQKVSNEERVQESRDRFKTAIRYIRQLKEIKIWEDDEGKVLNKKRVMEESEKVLRLAESIFMIMNIQVKELLESVTDSSLTMFLVEDRVALAFFYQILAPLVCDFPHAFLTKIKLGLLSVCGDVNLYKPNSSLVLEQKFKNGLFVLKELNNPDSIRDHWYKVVVWHFIKAEPRMFEEWKLLLQGEAASPVKKKEARSEVDELVHALKYVMRPHDKHKTKITHAEIKAKFIKRELKIFEPICFDEEWWDMKHKEDMFFQ